MRGGGRCGLAYRRPNNSKARKKTPADSCESPRTARRSRRHAMHFPRWPKRIWSFQVVGFIQDANPGRGDDPDRAISPAACIAVMRRKRHAGQPSAEPCGATRAGRGMHHAGVVLDQIRRTFAEAALALHATFRAEWEILATDGFAPTKVGTHQSSIGDRRIRADQGRPPPEQHQRRMDSCRPRSAPPPKQQPEWVTAASARTSAWRSRHGRRPGARSPASHTDRTGG